MSLQWLYPLAKSNFFGSSFWSFEDDLPFVSEQMDNPFPLRTVYSLRLDSEEDANNHNLYHGYNLRSCSRNTRRLSSFPHGPLPLLLI